LGAVVPLEAYLSLALSGCQDPPIIRLPSHVICVSLRRHAERSALAAALYFVRELARGTAGTGARPCSALAPRDVVHAVLGGLRDGYCEATLRFVGEESGVQGRGWAVVQRYVRLGALSFLLDVRSFFVAPQGKIHGENRRSCEVSCVVDDGGGRNAFIFRVCMDGCNVWRVDGVQSN
jgi:hypothetical protein